MKKFVLFHFYLETGFFSIIAFSDDKKILENIILHERHFGSNRHRFIIYGNVSGDSFLDYKKDICLVNICNNVADCLSVGEYAMLKKSYFKSQVWFERAKDFCSIAANILDNY